MPAYNLNFLSPDDARWTAFIQGCPDGNIFHHPTWLSLLKRAYGYKVWIAANLDPSGQVISGIPVAELRRPFKGRAWVSLPFTDTCQPLSRDTDSLQSLLDGLMEFRKSKSIPQVELRWNCSSHPDLKSAATFALHQIPLDSDFASVSARMHSMHKRNARTARQHGVQIEKGTSLEFVRDFYHLHRLTRKRQGVPVQPWHFFDLLRTEVLEKGKGFVLLARHEGNLLAGAVFLHDNKTLTYKFGASDSSWLNLRPNDLIFTEAIHWGCDQGYCILDLGRTDFENVGLRDFKKRWGAEETFLHYAYYPSIPGHHLTSRLMPILASFIRFSPPWVCQALGEILYSYAG